jgi:phage tail sheath gpL-like
MSTLSDAVSESARSAVVGYKVTKGDYSLSSPNLPQRVAILSEANTDKQTGLSLDPFETSSLTKVADKMGAGSPAYMAMRILRPLNGGGLSGIPTIIYPVATASGSTATVVTITVSGTATKTVKHNLIIAGRPSLDGQSYAVTVSEGNTAAQIVAKYIKAVNAVYGCPVTAAVGSTTTSFTLTSKWKGISSVFSARIEVI